MLDVLSDNYSIKLNLTIQSKVNIAQWTGEDRAAR